MAGRAISSGARASAVGAISAASAASAAARARTATPPSPVGVSARPRRSAAEQARRFSASQIFGLAKRPKGTLKRPSWFMVADTVWGTGVFSVEVETRCHGVALHASQPGRAIVVARRPGTLAYDVDVHAGAVRRERHAEHLARRVAAVG